MTELYKLGDSLKAHKIAASAHRINAARVDHRTSKHKGQFVDLRGNAYCVIDTPFKSELERKS